MEQFDFDSFFVNIKLRDRMKAPPYIDKKGHSYE